MHQLGLWRRWWVSRAELWTWTRQQYDAFGKGELLKSCPSLECHWDMSKMPYVNTITNNELSSNDKSNFWNPWSSVISHFNKFNVLHGSLTRERWYKDVKIRIHVRNCHNTLVIIKADVVYTAYFLMQWWNTTKNLLQCGLLHTHIARTLVHHHIRYAASREMMLMMRRDDDGKESEMEGYMKKKHRKEKKRRWM